MTTQRKPSRQTQHHTTGRFTGHVRPEAEISLGTSKWDALAADPEPMQRRLAAMKTTSRELRLHLSNDPDHRVRQGLAANPVTCRALLTILAADTDSDVVETAQQSLEHKPHAQYRRRSRDFAYGLENGTQR